MAITVGVVFFILQLIAIFLLIYALILIFRIITSPESGMDVGNQRRVRRNVDPPDNVNDEMLKKAFKTFGLSPSDGYPEASYRYYLIRKWLQSSDLDEQEKAKRIAELDALFDVLADYYTKKS
ncbi:MAG TPA: hypothetical protein DHW87_02805 [Fervidobacterium sp.]|nr:hypothetical protein [Fervidobacterium sp.]HUM75265.1 hypothetical protein [Fervidobacterium sp.]